MGVEDTKEGGAGSPSGGGRPTLPLGPFELHARIARGGMGEVWRGAHVAQGTQVAVKVITMARARRTETLEAFRNEIRASAGLDHPGVIKVFDHGTIQAETAALSRGALVQGSPYMVMEYASRGSLSRLKEPLRWREVRLVALSLLQALAHGHARGIIHRDLKPGNVLMAGAEDLRPGLKLTDFGIAHVLDSTSSAESRDLTIGTPMYMAPEQLRGQWRDYGPWTDLYALGCVVYKLTMGQAPFAAKDFAELCRLHLDSKPPVFAPTHPMPPALEAWVGRLLAKDPGERFQRAADAVAALEGIELSDERSPAPEAGTLQMSAVEGDEDEGDTRSDLAAATMMIEDPGALDTTGLTKPGELVARGDGGGRAVAPLMPDSWRRSEVPPNIQLLGVGLGLYGLHTIPLVDREELRDRLWEILKGVHGGGQARAALLTGSAGVGKSRLVEWICERAHELGVASIVRVEHSPNGGQSTGLAGMLAAQTRSLGLTHREALERLQGQLKALGVADPYEAAALVEIMSPATEKDIARGVAKIHFSRAVERHSVIARHLGRLGRERPLIVWMDDVQWGSDSLELVAHVLNAQDEQPTSVLFLLTARDEALAEAQVAWWALRDLLTLPGATQFEVGPLAPGDRATLIKELLALQGDLAAEVEERSGGNPQFAVQIVGDWVQRGVLEVGPGGFVLASGERPTLPDDLYGVWSTRVHRLLEAQPPQARVALEIAAIMGQSVNGLEWKLACANAKVALPLDLLDKLLATRLAKVAVGGWNFAHGMLRETIERISQEDGSWPVLHAACADMLADLYPRGGRRVAERRARHLLGAGLKAPAVDALLQAAEERLTEQEVRVARALLAQRDAALDDLEAPLHDMRRGQGKVALAKGLLFQDKHIEAHEKAAAAEQLARIHGWPLLPQALRIMGDVARRKGEFERAADLYREALTHFEAQKDDLGLANTLIGLAEVLQRRGQVDLAFDLTHKALKLFKEAGNEPGVAMSLKMLGQIAQSRGDLVRCEDLTQQALTLYARIGHKFGIANAHNVLAEVARHRGDLEAAEAGYRKAVEHFASVGADGLIPRLNLGLVLLARGQHDDARATLTEVELAFEERGGGGFMVYVHAALMACAPLKGDWDTWRRCADRAAEALADHKIYDRDIAWCTQLAADNAAAAGRMDEAAEAYAIALDQWKGLDDDEKVAEVSAAWAMASI